MDGWNPEKWFLSTFIPFYLACSHTYIYIYTHTNICLSTFIMVYPISEWCRRIRHDFIWFPSARMQSKVNASCPERLGFWNAGAKCKMIIDDQLGDLSSASFQDLYLNNGIYIYTCIECSTFWYPNKDGLRTEKNWAKALALSGQRFLVSERSTKQRWHKAVCKPELHL